MACGRRMRCCTRTSMRVRLGWVKLLRGTIVPSGRRRALPVAPRQIPYHAGFNYFELDTRHELWELLKNSGGLAMHLAGEFPGLELEFWAVRG